MERGKTSGDADTLTFRDGKFRSSACDKYGYSDATYKTSTQGDNRFRSRDRECALRQAALEGHGERRAEANSVARRCRHCAHHRGGPGFNAQLFVDSLQMLLHGARTDRQDRSNVLVGLAGAKPIEYVAFARGKRRIDARPGIVVVRSACAKTIQVTEVRPDDLEALAILIAKAVLTAVDHDDYAKSH